MSDNVIEGTAETVDDKTKGGKLDQFAGDSGDSATHGPEVLSAFLHDIANAPTAEGVQFKHDQAAEHFKADTSALAQITLVTTERKKALDAPKAEVTPPHSGGSRKLFQKPEGEAA